MFSLTRFAKAGYLLSFCIAVYLLVSPELSQAQFGTSGGFRGTPALPTIAIPTFSGSGSSSGSGGSITGFAGGSGSSSGSFSTQINYINLNGFFPNGGRILQLPPPTFMPELTNALSDTTGSPFAMIAALSMGGGIGIGGISFGGIGGAAGAGGGVAGGVGGFGQGGFAGAGIAGGGFGQIGGGGGFAGKGMGGFNGKKPF